MKIKIENYNGPRTIEEFADQNNLTMIVRERSVNSGSSRSRYYASFEHCDVKDGSMLIGAFGNGGTPEEAIADYAKEIRGKLLVFKAFRRERKEIYVPIFENNVKKMNKQPEALRLADALMDYFNVDDTDIDQAATELRRLHEVNQELLEALHSISLASQDSGSTREGMGLYARAAIAKATGESK